MVLNKKEIEKFKERLIQLRRQITHSIQGIFLVSIRCDLDPP